MDRRLGEGATEPALGQARLGHRGDVDARTDEIQDQGRAARYQGQRDRNVARACDELAVHEGSGEWRLGRRGAVDVEAGDAVEVLATDVVERVEAGRGARVGAEVDRGAHAVARAER